MTATAVAGAPRSQVYRVRIMYDSGGRTPDSGGGIMWIGVTARGRTVKPGVASADAAAAAAAEAETLPPPGVDTSGDGRDVGTAESTVGTATDSAPPISPPLLPVVADDVDDDDDDVISEEDIVDAEPVVDDDDDDDDDDDNDDDSDADVDVDADDDDDDDDDDLDEPDNGRASESCAEPDRETMGDGDGDDRAEEMVAAVPLAVSPVSVEVAAVGPAEAVIETGVGAPLLPAADPACWCWTGGAPTVRNVSTSAVRALDSAEHSDPTLTTRTTARARV
jgi:hypothetical protein